MRPGPTLLLLVLGLGGFQLLSALRGTQVSEPGRLRWPLPGPPVVPVASELQEVPPRPSFNVPSGHVQLRLLPRGRPAGSVVLSGSRSLCFTKPGGAWGRARRSYCLSLHALLCSSHPPTAPTHLHLRLAAPEGRLSLAWFAPLLRPPRHLRWTFLLRLLGPGSAQNRHPRSLAQLTWPRPRAGFTAETKCPTDGPTPVILEAVNLHPPKAIESSVSCHMRRCQINQVKVNRPGSKGPLRLNWKEDHTINATVAIYCPDAQSFTQFWEIFNVSKANQSSNWAAPLYLPQLQTNTNSSSLHIPKYSVTWGVYVVRLTVTITTTDPAMPIIEDLDYISIEVYRRPLKALILGYSSMTVNFTDELVLNGEQSADLEDDNPQEGLHFRWYCTTNPQNYAQSYINAASSQTCHPGQTDLRWTWATGPVLKIAPEMLKGDAVYFIRMVVEKNDRTAFADRSVHVLPGPTPTAEISCFENCGSILIISERFSLFLNCTNCGSNWMDRYTWSVESAAGTGLPFNWGGQTVTGRHRSYLSIKAFTFLTFLENQYWISLSLETWGGMVANFRYSFVINHAPLIGQCDINPGNGIAFVTEFVIHCHRFKDSNLPLTYKVIVSDLYNLGEITTLENNTLGAILYLGTRPRTPSFYLPVGIMANQFDVKLYVQVYDTLGSFSQVTLHATVQPPTNEQSPSTVIEQLFNDTKGNGSLLLTLLQKQEFLSAGYLMHIVASVLNSLRNDRSLIGEKNSLRKHLVNQTFLLPLTTLSEINQVVTIITELTQKISELTKVDQRLAIVRIRQAAQALQVYQQNDKNFRSEQMEIVSSGIFTVLSKVLMQITPHEVFQDPFYTMEALTDTMLGIKVPGSEATTLSISNLNVRVSKVELRDAHRVYTNEPHCQNCLYPTLKAHSVPDLLPSAPISTMFCEFADDPFPWLTYSGQISDQVIGYRMTGTKPNGDVVDVRPDVVEVYLSRRSFASAAFNLMMGPTGEPNEVDKSLKKTTGGFRFEVDTRVVKELMIHIETQVTVVFKVLVYAGSQVTPTALVATFLVPHDIPPTASPSGLLDLACSVKEARVVCLSQSLLLLIGQLNHSPKCAVTVVLQAPRFLLTPSDRLVRISVFSVHCLDMLGTQSDWREGNCILGKNTSWRKVHCICKVKARARRQVNSLLNLNRIQLRTHFITAKVIVIPNPVDLQLEVVKKINQKPVTLFTVLFILLIYSVLAFWALHKDEMDQFRRHPVVVLPDNDPYDNKCYLITIFTGSRWGSGTRADVFIQLMGSEGASDVHCLSHPEYKTLYRGNINTFLLTTKSDLGDIHSIRLWHNNEGKAPSWYLSRIKVESLFQRRIWLFLCRKWLSLETALDQTFPITNPEKPLNKIDFFLITSTYELWKSHMWFSIFAGIIAKPVNRLQRLSCCLAVLLSTLLCNIMFFNANRKEEIESKELYQIRLMMIAIQSTLITVPVQLLLSFLFTYSQKKPTDMTLDEVAPQEHHPVVSEEGGFWDEHLVKWYAYETTHKEETRQAEKLASSGSAELQEASEQTTSKTNQQLEEEESKAPQTSKKNINSNNKNADTTYNQDVLSEDPPSQEHPKPKTRILLPRWCVYIAWFLVFAICSISSFFIVFYGLTYGSNMSKQWLFTSVFSFFQSIFLVQTAKILLWTSFRTNNTQYCKSLPWTVNYPYTEITLPGLRKSKAEKHRQHLHIRCLRRSRMYQPLAPVEIGILKRQKRIKRRAFLFLSYLLMHFIFLALLLGLISRLRHADCFHYNQFIRDYFSMDLTTVTKLEHIYRWLSKVPLPLFHNDLNPTYLYDSSSQILGLPLMRQVRATPDAKRCLSDKNLILNGIKNVMHCHPKYGVDPEDTKNYSSFWKDVGKQAVSTNPNGFTYKPHENKWPYHSYGLLHTYGSGGYAFYFFPDQQQFNSTLRLKELQENHWLDEKTWAVILELTTFNPDVNLFCCVSIIFEVSQLGVVNSSASVHSFSLSDLNWNRSVEIYLYLAVLIFFLAYIVDEACIIAQERASYVRSVYNLLNFVLKCIFTVLIVFFLRKLLLTTDLIQLYLTNPKNFIPFHAIAQVDHVMWIILGFLLFLTILKTLRYSRVFYDVRLAQRAIQIALPGISHMAFVVSVYFFVYMTFGYLVFGQYEWNYCNLIHATQTVFSYCVSAFQNTKFSSNRVLGVLFLSSFMLIMICILVNLFQAVILSAYDEMKQPVYEEPSDEAEAMTYLCRKLRMLFRFLTCQPRTKEEPEFVTDMLYGQPEKKSRQYLGLKTRNINGKKMVYLVV
ncbi:polycystin family receptor for egg jelly-like [Tenrec ecaudatus]|uniref:polycystin family receptor for egg jelly-like n=1 Tax=Tenrec ecaudatus TaxID=94439 RepID=UPI003F59D809